MAKSKELYSGFEKEEEKALKETKAFVREKLKKPLKKEQKEGVFEFEDETKKKISGILGDMRGEVRSRFSFDYVKNFPKNKQRKMEKEFGKREIPALIAEMAGNDLKKEKYIETRKRIEDFSNLQEELKKSDPLEETPFLILKLFKEELDLLIQKRYKLEEKGGKEEKEIVDKKMEGIFDVMEKIYNEKTGEDITVKVEKKLGKQRGREKYIKRGLKGKATEFFKKEFEKASDVGKKKLYINTMVDSVLPGKQEIFEKSVGKKIIETIEKEIKEGKVTKEQLKKFIEGVNKTRTDDIKFMFAGGDSEGTWLINIIKKDGGPLPGHTAKTYIDGNSAYEFIKKHNRLMIEKDLKDKKFNQEWENIKTEPDLYNKNYEKEIEGSKLDKVKNFEIGYRKKLGEEWDKSNENKSKKRTKKTKKEKELILRSFLIRSLEGVNKKIKKSYDKLRVERVGKFIKETVDSKGGSTVNKLKNLQEILKGKGLNPAKFLEEIYYKGGLLKKLSEDPTKEKNKEKDAQCIIKFIKKWKVQENIGEEDRINETDVKNHFRSTLNMKEKYKKEEDFVLWILSIFLRESR